MKRTRRNGLKIMIRLFGLLGSLNLFMILAVLNGLLGNLMAFAVPVMASVAVVKALGGDVLLSYNAIIGIVIACGALRGFLRYLEQYANHLIAFRILAILRMKVFQALRRLGPAWAEEKEKGGLLSLVTSDIETLEVFYAHTISPLFIAILHSLIVFLLVGFLSSFYLALLALHAENRNTMVTISHDRRILDSLADRVLWIEEGRIRKEGDVLVGKAFFEQEIPQVTSNPLTAQQRNP